MIATYLTTISPEANDLEALHEFCAQNPPELPKGYKDRWRHSLQSYSDLVFSRVWIVQEDTCKNSYNIAGICLN
jgi:hypothetical protein